jgi:osmotically-inducible protein OsmY
MPALEVWGKVMNMRRLLVPLPLACALLAGCRTNETPRAQVNDLEITAQVKSKLASDVGLASVTDIAVNSTNGIVTLSGQVDSADRKAKADAVASSVPKVVRVVDNLQVAVNP